MLHRSTLRFLKDLRDNNNVAWADAHREAWHAAREDLMALGRDLIAQAKGFDSAIAVKGEDAMTLTRFNRDPRFRRGGPSYKSDVDLFFNSGGKAGRAGFYLHVEPGGRCAGGSLFVPDRAALHRVRDLIAHHTDEWDAIIDAKPFRAAFPDGIECQDAVKTIPRGYDADHPAVEYLRMKGWGTRAKLSEKQVWLLKNSTRAVGATPDIQPSIKRQECHKLGQWTKYVLQACTHLI